MRVLVLSHNTLILQWVAIIWIHVHEGNPLCSKTLSNFKSSSVNQYCSAQSIPYFQVYHLFAGTIVVGRLPPAKKTVQAKQKKVNVEAVSRGGWLSSIGHAGESRRDSPTTEDLQKADSGGPDFINRDLPVVVGNFAGFLVLSLVRV